MKASSFLSRSLISSSLSARHRHRKTGSTPVAVAVSKKIKKIITYTSIKCNKAQLSDRHPSRLEGQFCTSASVSSWAPATRGRQPEVRGWKDPGRPERNREQCSHFPCVSSFSYSFKHKAEVPVPPLCRYGNRAKPVPVVSISLQHANTDALPYPDQIDFVQTEVRNDLHRLLLGEELHLCGIHRY